MSGHSPNLTAALGLLTTAKVKLSLDPSLYTSKTVTAQIAGISQAIRLLRSHLEEASP